MKYFVQTTRFSPASFEELGFVKADDHLYRSQEDGSIWAERALYDLGWGRERGLCRLPLPNFEQLISFAFVPQSDAQGDIRYNYWGALSVLLDDYCMDLIQYVQKNIAQNKETANRYLHIWRYMDNELNLSEHQILALSNRDLAKCCQEWKKIRERYALL
jgi:hypothetical protein